LKRPTLPYWVNSDVQSPPIPKEFYAQPQKFSRPLWPPSSSIDSQESLNLDAAKETASKEIVSKGTTLKEIVTKEAASKETIGTIQVFSINSNISYSMIKLLLLNDEFDESICVSGTDPGVGFDAGESRSNGCANVN